LAERELSQLDIVASQLKDKTVMIEAGALQVEEPVLVESIERAHVETKKIIALIEDLVTKVGQKKLEVVEDPLLHELAALIEKSYTPEVEALIKARVNKESGGDDTAEVVTKIYDDYKAANPKIEVDKKVVIAALDKVMYKLSARMSSKTVKEPTAEKWTKSEIFKPLSESCREPMGARFSKEGLRRLYQLLLLVHREWNN